MKFDRETRLRLEEPFRRARAEILKAEGLEPEADDSAGGPCLGLIQSEGRYLAAWELVGGEGATPEEAIADLYRNFRKVLRAAAHRLDEDARQLHIKAAGMERRAVGLYGVAEEFPPEPPLF